MEFKSPKQLYDEISNYVVGQEAAKRMLVTAAYSHMLRCNQDPKSPIQIEKTNMILAGPTGSGKTYLAKTLARCLRVPIAIADATALTQAGYVGEDVENCLLRLINAADGDVNLAEHGIVFIDEIDKLSRKSESPSITRDVSGEGVQQALLKIVEGSVVNVPASGGRKRPDGVGYIPIDTSNILFILSGAFEGIKDYSTASLIHYGMIPELVGRCPSVAILEKLSKDQLIHVLADTQNNLIAQYSQLFAMAGASLEISPKIYDIIADYAMNQNIGARGLRGVLESVLQPVIFRLPSKSKFILATHSIEDESLLSIDLVSIQNKTIIIHEIGVESNGTS